MVNSENVGIKSTYKSMRAPYGGEITAVISCGAKEYLKEESVNFHGQKTSLLFAVANQRKIYGNCSVEQIKFASLFWNYYDPKRKQVVKIKLFKKVSAPDQVSRSHQELKIFFNSLMGLST